MSENKFIQHLKGKATAGSVVEIKNQATPASFANMPSGTSNANNVYADIRGNATVVAQGTTNWKLDGVNLVLASNVSGDGNDYTGVYGASGARLWVNATYTFPSTGDPNHPVAMIFNPNTKWVLKLCGDNLLANGANTIDFSLVITIGSSNIITKNFTVAEQANKFCKEFVIDFAESNADLIKASGTATMQVQLLCATASATARIYNGMTVFTALQRKVDASVVSGSFANVEEVMRDGILPNDYFSNAAYIAQITDGDTAYAVFQRDGDDVALCGWAQPIPDQSGNANKFLMTDGSDMSWEEIQISHVDGLQTELTDLQNQIDDLSGRGRFLSIWNCVTGLAETNPPESPYTYQAGDYFLVGVVGTTNYKPTGSSYTTGVASTVVETAEVNIDDTYIYDGTTWKLQANSQRTYTFAGIAGSPYDNANLTSALNAKQDTLVNQTNIKSVNGNSLLGSGDLELSTYLTFPAGWSTTGTTKAFCDAIAADDTAVKGKAYLGEATFSDLPGSMVNAEIIAEVLDSTTAANKVIVLTCTSGNIAPYRWQYTYWNGGSNVSGWVTWATSAQGALADTAVQPADLATYVTTNTTQTITGEKVFRGIMNYSAGMTYILAGADGTKLGYWSYDIDGQSNITLQTMTASTRNINFKTNNGGKVTYNGSEIAKVSAIPTAVSQLSNDSGFITNAVNDLQNYTLSSSLATVATSGDYDDLINKPTIPAAQVNSDWNANSGVAEILNKPTLGTAAAADTTDFATAAQGAKADTALQPGDNITQLVNNAGYLGVKNAITTSTNLDNLSAGVYPVDLVSQHPQLPTGLTTAYGVLIQFTGNYKPQLLVAGIVGECEIYYRRWLTGSSSYTTWEKITPESALATVATTGDYDDLLNKPAIPTVNDATITITQGGVTKGSFTLNQASGDTIALDAGGGGSSTLAGLSDVTITSPATDEVLTYDGSKWVNAPQTGGYHPDLFDYKWADHEISDMQWLSANAFSWQSGSGYSVAYQHLVDDISGKTAQSETVGGITISFYLADDGHKITTDESAVAQIYTATGVAWYYVLDTVNQRFKLPRIDPDRVLLNKSAPVMLDNTVVSNSTNSPLIVGNVATGNGSTGNNSVVSVINYTSSTLSGTLSTGYINNNAGVSNDVRWIDPNGSLYTDFTASSGEFCGKKYLYFYVGSFSQTAVENTAGLNASLFNNKVDLDGSNATFTHIIGFQEPTANNSYTWYIKYSNGFVIQGGRTTHANGAGANDLITLPIEFANTEYCVLPASGRTDGVADASKGVGFSIVGTTSFYATMYTPSGWGSQSTTFSWVAFGMAA